MTLSTTAPVFGDLDSAFVSEAIASSFFAASHRLPSWPWWPWLRFPRRAGLEVAEDGVGFCLSVAR